MIVAIFSWYSYTMYAIVSKYQIKLKLIFFSWLNTLNHLIKGALWGLFFLRVLTKNKLNIFLWRIITFRTVFSFFWIFWKISMLIKTANFWLIKHYVVVRIRISQKMKIHNSRIRVHFQDEKLYMGIFSSEFESSLQIEMKY